MLTLIFCSVVTVASTEQKNENEANGILTKTLKEVKTFKEEKNYEIKLLKAEVTRLKKKLNASKSKERNNLKKLRLSQKKVSRYKKFETKVKRELKAHKETIKDLHFLIKQKSDIAMDQYALGRYYLDL